MNKRPITTIKTTGQDGNLRGKMAAPPPPLQPEPTNPSELALHELGESMVASAISIQRELQRYAGVSGSFHLEDLEIEIPMKLRIDPLGQVLAEIIGKAAPEIASSRIRLRIRPKPGPADPPPVLADQPLTVLRILSPVQISALEAHRIFSVEDLVRAARHLSGKKGLKSLIPEPLLDRALERSTLLLTRDLPQTIAQALLESGIESIGDFLAKDAAALAQILGPRLGSGLTKVHVEGWQKALGASRWDSHATNIKEWTQNSFFSETTESGKPI